MSACTLADFSQVTNNAWPYFLGPVGAVLALIAAFLFSRSVMSRPEGDDNMIEIAQAVRDGAMAYLKRQYKVVAGVFVLLVAILAVLGFAGIQFKMTAIGVPIAGLFSGLCGWFGMKMATNASARTTYAAKQSLNDGLRVRDDGVADLGGRLLRLRGRAGRLLVHTAVGREFFGYICGGLLLVLAAGDEYQDDDADQEYDADADRGCRAAATASGGAPAAARGTSATP